MLEVPLAPGTVDWLQLPDVRKNELLVPVQVELTASALCGENTTASMDAGIAPQASFANRSLVRFLPAFERL